MEELRNFTLLLSLTKGIGIKTYLGLVEEFGSIEALYNNYIHRNLDPQLIANLAGLDVNIAIKRLLKSNIKFTCLWEDSYPPLLKEIPDAPIVLFYVGNIQIAQSLKLISIVGTRKISPYGKYLLDKLVPNLVAQNIPIVSGLAYGVDAYAHNLTLQHNGQTIAALPCSVDSPVPKENYYLYSKILDSNGLIFSDAFPGTKVVAGSFPKRNRIIAGLSESTIVIEAGIKSGALITAKLAFDYDREVLAYPGNVNTENSKGCNYLIRNNIATLADSFFEYNKNVDIAKLSKDEQKVYYAILHGQKDLERLSEILNLEIKYLSEICTKLILNGILNTDNQNNFYIN